MKNLTITLFALIMFTSCVTVQTAPLSTTSGEPEIYMSKKPDRPYKEVAFIETSGSVFHSNKKLLKKLKEKAKKESSDGVVDVKFGYVFWWPYATGISIQYTK